MDVSSNDDSLIEIRKYFEILIFADSYWPRKLEDRENFRVYGISPWLYKLTNTDVPMFIIP